MKVPEKIEASISELLYSQYGIMANAIDQLSSGAGSNNYLITNASGQFIFKDISANDMNVPENEPALCEYLLDANIPVCRFIKDKQGNVLWRKDGKTYHLREWFDGTVFELNTAPSWLMHESAVMLGRIHTALEGYPKLPTGIGHDFFKFMTPNTAKGSYLITLRQAKKKCDSKTVRDVEYRLSQLDRISKIKINLNKLTCQNTHGDYSINQLVCKDDRIQGVIDWTSACIHPICWEIIRSYTYTSPSCSNGSIDINEFLGYVRAYLSIHKLNEYDLAMMPYLFYYQIGVCDYYGQYYHSLENNRYIFLHQAQFATELIRWFETNIDELSESLMKLL